MTTTTRRNASDWADRERQKRAQGEEQIEPRQRQEKLGDAHQEFVSPAAVIARGHADQRAEKQSDSRAEKAGEKRDLSAVKNARELIAAVGVAAEEIDSCIVGTPKRCKRDGIKPSETVGGAAGEKTQRNGARGVLFVLVE